MWKRAPVLLALLLVLALRLEPAAGAGDVVGSFRLPKGSFAVGEPILVEFTVKNERKTPFSFYEGGDYRFTLRHDLYSFRVVDAAGRDFTQTIDGHEGGVGAEIRVEPGKSFLSWQLLNGWVHLLPPGSYRVHCERKLGPPAGGSAGKAETEPPPVVVAQDLAFEVTPYAKASIGAAMAAMHELDASPQRRGTFFAVPVEWALADLNEKLELGLLLNAQGADDERATLAALPTAWDDARYVEYGFRANRNWVTPVAPEPFELTFTARNNATVPLPHGLVSSMLLVNGAAVPRWSTRMAELLASKGIPGMIAPGAVVELTARFDDLAPLRGTASIGWTLGRVKRSVDLRVGR